MQTKTVNPNRMELRKARAKFSTAQKGYDLLKDKTNGLIRDFSLLIRETKDLRREVDTQFIKLIEDFNYAKIKLSKEDLNLLFALPTCGYNIDFKKVSSSGTITPKIEIQKNEYDINLPYSPIDKRTLLDSVVQRFYELFPSLVKLAEKEKSSMLIAREIEKCKRRVNALENILLPQYKKIIAQIELKLAEDERANLSRLIKLKSI